MLQFGRYILLFRDLQFLIYNVLFMFIRDTFVYAASADVRGLEAVIKILGNVIFRPQLTMEEVNL